MIHNSMKNRGALPGTGASTTGETKEDFDGRMSPASSSCLTTLLDESALDKESLYAQHVEIADPSISPNLNSSRVHGSW